ncbi:hypothetical protein KY334_02285 [Candidatus Woesearchaeota archaeon]|nr:hypothetical protein [Candidatus Woesearchaeota archaeon]
MKKKLNMKNLFSILALSTSLLIGCQSSKNVVQKGYPNIQYNKDVHQEAINVKYSRTNSNQRLNKISNYERIVYDDVPKLKINNEKLLEIVFEEEKYSCSESESRLCLFIKLDKDDVYRLFLRGACQNNYGGDFYEDKKYNVSFGIERKF